MSKPKIKFYRIYKDTPGPERMTLSSIGFDIRSPHDVTLHTRSTLTLGMGLVVQAPKGYYYTLHLRSGFAINNNVVLTNSVGIIDSDYCGANDQIMLAMTNLSSEHVRISKGDRIAQIIFHKNDLPEYELEEQEERDFADMMTRGGLGSTGIK